MRGFSQGSQPQWLPGQSSSSGVIFNCVILLRVNKLEFRMHVAKMELFCEERGTPKGDNFFLGNHRVKLICKTSYVRPIF